MLLLSADIYIEQMLSSHKHEKWEFVSALDIVSGKLMTANTVVIKLRKVDELVDE